jgi:ADP-ribose pyrophosphatase YjhB (NUDIX family)
MPADAADRPQLAASAAIFREGKVLLVRRARSPGLGRYSLPGGRVEFGESLTEAVMREVREETGLSIAVVGLAGWREALPNPAHGMTGHYVIMSFAARWSGGEVRLNDELDDALWRVPGDYTGLPTTDGLDGIIQAAFRMVSG